MANDNDKSGNGISGSELQESQSGGGSGEFGGNRDQQQSGQAGHGGQQMGGGVTQADLNQAGGSSGTGGYGNAQNQQNHQGQQSQAAYGNSSDAQQSRGERFDELQGGGRGTDTVSRQDGNRNDGADPQLDAAADELLSDQQAHQDRGQSNIEEEDEQA